MDLKALIQLEACPAGVSFLTKHKTWEHAIEACNNLGWYLWLFTKFGGDTLTEYRRAQSTAWAEFKTEDEAAWADYRLFGESAWYLWHETDTLSKYRRARDAAKAEYVKRVLAVAKAIALKL
jgi:hypothetical protein